MNVVIMIDQHSEFMKNIYFDISVYYFRETQDGTQMLADKYLQYFLKPVVIYITYIFAISVDISGIRVLNTLTRQGKVISYQNYPKLINLLLKVSHHE